VVRFRLLCALTIASTLAVAVPSALADTVESSNWAGYAVHKAGIRFTRVAAVWRQPKPTCSAGTPGFSAMWVGLGGFNQSSDALEQIGSEMDCTSSGRAVSSVWYELVPAPSRTIKMTVHAGDQLAATVTVSGNRVILALIDLTSHHSFKKAFTVANPDVSSAEWIVEAPSECINQNTCQTLPLADFGSTTFSLARAEAVGGHIGSISDPFWNQTQILLTPGGRRFVVLGGSGPTAGAAIPSALASNGMSFKVTFSTVSVSSGQVLARRSAVARAGYLVHPGR
jgi:Peptidase A4 family